MDAIIFPILIVLLLLIAFVGGVAFWVYKVRIPRDMNAPHRLGEAMGLERLNEGSRKIPTWYGGCFQDHDFALTYVNLQYSENTSIHERSFDDVVLSLRLAIATNLVAPQEIIAYFQHGRRFQPGRYPESFESGFDWANTDKLSAEAKAAMLEFTQNYGSLRLRDRATAPAGLFAQEVLSESAVILIHDRPGHKQRPEEIESLLAALRQVCLVLEKALAGN